MVTTITGSLPERAREVQEREGFLRFKAFDALAYNGADITAEPYCARDSCLCVAVDAGFHINYAPVEWGERKRHLYVTVIANGGEGIILKNLDAPYYQGERHKSWVKVKKKKTFDVVCLGFEIAKDMTIKKGDTEPTPSRIYGKVGAIVYGQYVLEEPRKTASFEYALDLRTDSKVALKELGTTSGFSDTLREDMTNNPSVYIGRVLECEAQEQFVTGALRHPRFLRWRDDKRAEDCIFRANEA